MARRYVGDATVYIRYNDRGDYSGSIVANGVRCTFEDLHAPAFGLGAGVAYDSSEAYDKMAASAVSFMSYYTSHNRSEDTPDWAPAAEVADAIAEATAWASDDRGEYSVTRRKGA